MPNAEKIAIFVDVQNIYYTVRQQFNSHFNYRAFWEQLSRQGDISHAYAYAIDRNDAKQLQFQRILRNIGFDVKLKPFIQRGDGSAKGDWDVGITIDILQTAPIVDRIILASGDGDFDILLTTVRQQFGIQTEVYSVEQLTARSLIDASNQYQPINHLLLLH